MRNFATRIRLACIVVLMPTVVAFGQQTANPETNVQNAVTYFGSMIQATRSRRTHQTIYPTRASVNIELKVRSWTSPFTRKPWPSHRAGHEPCRSITVYQQRIQQRFDQRAEYLTDIRLAENITFVTNPPFCS